MWKAKELHNNFVDSTANFVLGMILGLLLVIIDLAGYFSGIKICR